MARYGMIVDIEKCTGCMSCVVACKYENLTGPGVSWNRILTIESEVLDADTYIRYACMHCDHPPCVEACPRIAISKRPDGIVLIDQQKCQGQAECLGKCIDACPYGVIAFNPGEEHWPVSTPSGGTSRESGRLQQPGKASKCSLCAHRIDKGRIPICVEVCQAGALIFEDLDNLSEGIREKLGQTEQLLPEKGARPNVYYFTTGNFLKQLDQQLREDPGRIRQQQRPG